MPTLNLPKTAEEIYAFIQGMVKDAAAEGVVIGLSGGVDSSLTLALCAKALGSDKVLGVLMPTDFTPKKDVEDAQKLAEQFGITTRYVNIQSSCDRLFEALGSKLADTGQRMVRANVYARMRMTILYYYANLRNYLVIGTGDRSEALIGFFTKYGDGGADLFPIIHLYKTQVRRLASYLGVPETVSRKPSSPQLYPGHMATDEIPLEYEKLDLILVGLFDRKASPVEVSCFTGIPAEVVEDVSRRFASTKHKRAFPPMVRELET